MSMFPLVILVFTLVSVVSGAIGAIMSLKLYGSPSQHRKLTRPRTRFLLSLSFGVLAGISWMPLLIILWWLGLYASSTIVAALIATVVFVTMGTYGGYTIGVKIFEKQVDD